LLALRREAKEGSSHETLVAEKATQVGDLANVIGLVPGKKANGAAELAVGAGRRGLVDEFVRGGFKRCR
jgi:hypothetical protein